MKSKSYKSSKYNKTNKDLLKGGDIIDQDSYLDYFKCLEVKVYNNNFDRAFKAFRALVQKERILSLYKEKQSYEKPSDKKRRKRNEMRQKMLELEYAKKSPPKKKKMKSEQDQNEQQQQQDT